MEKLSKPAYPSFIKLQKLCLNALILVLDLMLIGREFQSFAAVTPSVSRLYLGQRIVISP